MKLRVLWLLTLVLVSSFPLAACGKRTNVRPPADEPHVYPMQQYPKDQDAPNKQ